MNDKLVNDYKAFLDAGKTERECVNEIIRQAEANGYKDIATCDTLKPGDKVYVQHMGRAIALFAMGSDDLSKGMNILGAHIDSPRLDIKQNPMYEKDFLVYLNTHYYGGIKKYQWLTIPLAIHGVVCKTDGTTVNVCIGEDSADPVLCISDILPHLAQTQYTKTAAEFVPGESLDLIIGSEGPAKPEEKKEGEEKAEEKKEAVKDAAKAAVLAMLKDKYGFEEADFASAELEVVPAGNARDLGIDRTMILAYGQDDRSCAYTSARALFDSATTTRTNCCLCVDKEEIGSAGATGMASHFFENAVAEVVARQAAGYSELTLKRCLKNSTMLSSDVSAAWDPFYPDVFDRTNSCFLGGGIVFNKYTGSRGKVGASDAAPEFIAKIRGALDAEKVPYQTSELGKVDQGGGGTIAQYCAKYGMAVLDAGVPVLSMHAPHEITAKADIEGAYDAYCAFLKHFN